MIVWKTFLLGILILIFASTASAQNWQVKVIPGGGWVDALGVDKDGYIYAGAYFNSFYVSSDRGETWWNSSDIQSGLFEDMVVDDSLGTIFVVTDIGGGVRKSTDKGKVWGEKMLKEYYVQSIAMATDRTLYVGTADSGMFRSTDYGQTWEPAGLKRIGPGWPVQGIERIVVHPDGDVFALGGYLYIYHSSDKGKHWDTLSYDFEGNVLYDIAFGPTGTMYAGGANPPPPPPPHILVVSPIFKSTDKGKTWSSHPVLDNGSTIARLGSPSPGVVICLTGASAIWRSLDDCETIHGFGGPSFAGSTGSTLVFDKELRAYVGSNGVVQYTAEPVVLSAPNAPAAGVFSLGMPYPNPVTNWASVPYEVVTSGRVRVALYDGLGRLVRALADDYRNPGVYTASLNAAGLPPGVYHIRMAAGGATATRAVVVR